MRHRLAIATTLAALAVGAAVVATRPPAPPTYEEVRAAWRPSEAWLLDRHGRVLDSRRVEFGVRRLEWTPLEAVSPALREAIVRGEDRRFGRHAGVDWIGVAAALRDGLRGRPRGASTISMQVAMQVTRHGAPGAVPRTTRTLAGKLRQMRLASRLEASWSKPRILEAYLNLLSFRGELQGVAAAARHLAGKDPAGLTADEAAVLAALLPHPSASAEGVARRACARAGAAPATPACETLGATTARLLARERAPAADRLAPHLATRMLATPGEHVRASLDARVQRVARDALARQLGGLAARNVRDGAAIVVDNATGEVLAYVGSAGPASRAPAVDGVRAPRQAGSTLKPFLYAQAIGSRYLTAGSLLDDSPVAIDTGNGLYQPRDYDHVYRGLVSVRTALAASLNVPAVRALQLVGVESFRDRLRAVGFEGLEHDGAWYGFSLALGSADVTLWEQATAWRALANGGRTGPLSLRPVEEGDRATADGDATHQVLSPEAAWIVADVLADRGARAVTFGLDSALATPYWAAVKTGTSKDMRDNWCVGFTPRYTVAVWVGNFEGDAMQGVSGVSGAAPAWREIMDALQGDAPSSPPALLPGLERQPLRFAGAAEPAREEWFLAGTAPAREVRAADPATRRARIGNPVDGTVIALDPDIPATHQRLALAVDGDARGLTLTVDGVPVGSGASTVLWRPSPGRHEARLADASGRVLDQVRFSVR